jgi:hypothetical protein
LDRLEELSIWPANPKRFTDFSEMAYSQGYWLKKYLFYPHIFDLYVTLQHGIYLDDVIMDDDEILQETDIFFAFNESEKYNRYKKTFVSGSAFILYKEMYHIKKEEPKYTLVFPIHSRVDVEWDIDIDDFIAKLKKLPKKFEPLLICVYFRDIHKGMHHKFIEAGFEVTTIGHGSRYDFIPRFYELLKNAKYTLSNDIGSYAFYSIDLGIPFVLYNRVDIYGIKNNKKFLRPKGIDKEYIFESLNAEITPQQKEIVYKYLGKKRDNRLLLSFILYKEFFKFQIKFLKRWIFKFYLEYFYTPKKYLYLGELEPHQKRYIEYLYQKYKQISIILELDNFQTNEQLVVINTKEKISKKLLDTLFNSIKVGGILVFVNISKHPYIKRYFIEKFRYKTLLAFENMFVIRKIR